MKKNILIGMLLLAVLSGCVNTGFLADPDEEVKMYYDQVQAIFDFDERDFPYTPVGCWGKILCESGASGFQFGFEPQGGFKYLVIASSVYGFNAFSITDDYLSNYLLNDLIENRKYGNKMDEFFLKLEDMGIKYYIQNAKGILDKFDYDMMVSKGSATCVLDMPFDDIEPKVESYLRGKDARTIDWMQFIKDFGCNPKVTIYIRENTLEMAGVTIEDIQKLATDYYNDEYVNVIIMKPVFERENDVKFIADSVQDSRVMTSEDEEPRFAPVYNWDK